MVPQLIVPSLFRRFPGSTFYSLIILGAVLAGCDSRTDETPYTPRETIREPSGVARGSSTKERQLEFLNRIREADPQSTTIQRAVMNQENELGLVLGRNVEMDSIPPLMRSMLSQMAREFPGQDLTVIVYAPANPPVKIGTARLDANSGEMTYKRTKLSTVR
jgi:hypothetical protein